jgi:hypothetical protein
MATQEGAVWRPGPVRWDTARTDGFDTLGQAELLLRGHATQWLVALGGSWLPQLGVRPAVSVVGGTIAYRGGAWVIDMHLTGWGSYGGGNSSPTKIKQHAITFEQIDDGSTGQTLRWRDTDASDGLHDSVTFEDLGHVGLGLNVSLANIGPDTGWDV